MHMCETGGTNLGSSLARRPSTTQTTTSVTDTRDHGDPTRGGERRHGDCSSRRGCFWTGSTDPWKSLTNSLTWTQYCLNPKT